ncbi:MAG TPA: PH domain-containing protein [Anaerolineales bacterium]|nr:PH domain-containing protein [Anaerolineales bacterium]
MAIEQVRAQIIASVWQAVAQSGVDLSPIPQEQQEKLVGKIADSLMVTMDGMLDEVTPTQPPVEMETAQPEGEHELWRGRPFMSLVENYIITSERLKITRGFLSRDIENYELIRIQDIDLSQGITERMMGIGDIRIVGQDPSHGEIILRNVPKPEEVYEIMRQAWLAARKRHGLQFREYM